MGLSLYDFYQDHQTLLHSVLVLVVAFLTTILTRFMPFIIFRKKSAPKSIITLGEILPPAMIGMLLVYCFASTDIAHAPFGLNELCGFILTALLYLITKVGVIAVIGGTLGYATIVQTQILDKLFLPI